MKKERSKYGTGTVYKQGKSYIAQMYYTVDIDGKSFSKRISGSGQTEAKAIRNRNKNIKKWEEAMRESLSEVAEKKKEEEREKSKGPLLTKTCK